MKTYCELTAAQGTEDRCRDRHNEQVPRPHPVENIHRGCTDNSSSDIYSNSWRRHRSVRGADEDDRKPSCGAVFSSGAFK